MPKRKKSRLGGHHNNLGSKTWRKRIYANDGEFVKAGSIIMKINKSIKLGDNVYRSKNIIHSKIDGIVRIKGDRVYVDTERKRS